MFPTTPKFASTGAQLNRKQCGHATRARELRYYLQKSESESTIQTTTLQRFFFDERSHFVDFFFFLLFGKNFNGSWEINMNKLMVLLVFLLYFAWWDKAREIKIRALYIIIHFTLFYSRFDGVVKGERNGCCWISLRIPCTILVKLYIFQDGNITKAWSTITTRKRRFINIVAKNKFFMNLWFFFSL